MVQALIEHYEKLRCQCYEKFSSLQEALADSPREGDRQPDYEDHKQLLQKTDINLRSAKSRRSERKQVKLDHLCKPSSPVQEPDIPPSSGPNLNSRAEGSQSQNQDKERGLMAGATHRGNKRRRTRGRKRTSQKAQSATPTTEPTPPASKETTTTTLVTPRQEVRGEEVHRKEATGEEVRGKETRGEGVRGEEVRSKEVVRDNARTTGVNTPAAVAAQPQPSNKRDQPRSQQRSRTVLSESVVTRGDRYGATPTMFRAPLLQQNQFPHPCQPPWPLSRPPQIFGAGPPMSHPPLLQGHGMAPPLQGHGMSPPLQGQGMAPPFQGHGLAPPVSYANAVGNPFPYDRRIAFWPPW